MSTLSYLNNIGPYERPSSSNSYYLLPQEMKEDVANKPNIMSPRINLNHINMKQSNVSKNFVNTTTMIDLEFHPNNYTSILKSNLTKTYSLNTYEGDQEKIDYESKIGSCKSKNLNNDRLNYVKYINIENNNESDIIDANDLNKIENLNLSTPPDENINVLKPPKESLSVLRPPVESMNYINPSYESVVSRAEDSNARNLIVSGPSISYDKFINQANTSGLYNISPIKSNLIIHKNNFQLKNCGIVNNVNITNIISTNTKNELSSLNLNKSKSTYLQDKSNIQLYLDRRHLQEQERLNKMRKEKLFRENAEIRDRPNISKNSKKIIETKLPNYKTVFERLSDRNQFRKKNEELMIIEKINKHDIYPHEPKINEKSKNVKRGVKDLYEWNENKLKKRHDLEEIKVNKNELMNPNISPVSEIILKELNPSYLEMKVEDRLLNKGKQIKAKIENLKEEIFINLTRSKSTKKLTLTRKTENIEIIKAKSSKNLNILSYSPSKIIPKGGLNSVNIASTIKPKLKRKMAESYVASFINRKSGSNITPNYISNSTPITTPLPFSVSPSSVLHESSKVENAMIIDNQSIIRVRQQLHKFLNKNSEKKISSNTFNNTTLNTKNNILASTVENNSSNHQKYKKD